MEKKCIIGIDWGGTRIKLGAVGYDGSIVASELYDSPKSLPIDTLVDELIQKLTTFIASLEDEVTHIGMALTGPVDPQRGVVLLPGKVDGLEGYPVVPRLKEHFKVPVLATNDGLAALYAEKYHGHARGLEYAVSLTIGTGVGSGVMIAGAIPEDPNFMFGIQAGHLVIDRSDDRLCLTGARGTGEINCSATALALAVRSGLQRGIPSLLSERYWKNPHSIDFKTVIEAGVANQDPLCLDELRRWTVRVGWLLVNTVHAYSPQVIILSGGATKAAAYFLEPLQEHVNRHIFRYPKGKEVPIRTSQLTERSGILGAAMMMMEKESLSPQKSAT